MRAVIYARFSSDNQRSESIDAQVRACEEYATKNKLSIVKIYSDEALSGTTDKRPQFQKMISDSEADLFDVVIVHKLDRFARDKYDAVVYKRKLRNAGIKLYSVTENIDGSPESIILESVIEGMAQYYSENLAREVMKGLTENALKCKHTGGKPPFGYDVNSEKEYVINNHEAIAAREMFLKYSKGESYRDIIKWLNGKGYKTKFGNDFTKTSLFSIFNNEKYKGVYVFNKVKRVRQGDREVDIPHDSDDVIRIEGGIPSIVASELWDLVQKKMRYNAENMRSARAKENYLLAGRLFCGKCKGRMIGNRASSHKGTSIFSGYFCSEKKKGNPCSLKGIKKETIENAVLNFLDNYIFCDSFLEELTGKIGFLYKDYINDTKENVHVFEGKLNEINRKINKNLDAIEDGLYTQSLKNRMQELELQKIEIQKMIYEEKNKKRNVFDEKQIKEFLEQGREIKEKEFEEQKRIVNIFVNKIYLQEDKFEICFFIDIRRDKETAKFFVLDLAVVDGGGSPLQILTD